MMKVHYYFEEKHYLFEDMKKNFNQVFLDQLLENKICTVVSNGTSIKFEFVGVLDYQDNLYFVVPKYMNRSTPELGFQKKMKLILKVLRKYGTRVNSTDDSLDFLFPNPAKNYFSMFALADFLLEDFLNYNYYSVIERKVEINGGGETLWDRTINELTPIFSNNTPYYLDTYNFHENKNELSVILKIHKWAVNYCYNHYGEWLGYEDAYIEPNMLELDTIGATEYLVGVLDKELNTTFNDQKINLLKALKSIVELKGSYNTSQLNIYGVRIFDRVWENVCATIFENEYEKYKEKIPHPTWYTNEYDKTFEKATLMPDIIKTYTDGPLSYFLILDAKYYNIRFTNTDVLGNPSLEDVSKQLLYMQALEKEHAGKITRNYFLFPKDGKEELPFILFGKAGLEFVTTEPILLVYLSDETVYNRFLKNLTISLEEYRELEKITKNFCSE